MLLDCYKLVMTQQWLLKAGVIELLFQIISAVGKFVEELECFSRDTPRICSFPDIRWSKSQTTTLCQQARKVSTNHNLHLTNPSFWLGYVRHVMSLLILC